VIELYLIVGIDPGTTTGIAALNFKGELIDLTSSKNMSLDLVIKHLISLGRISIIATDVTPTPGFISKLSAQLGSRIYTPIESMNVNEKIELTQYYKPKNKHQRDALAAAIYTFNKFKNKLQKIDSLNLGDDVKNLVLHGYSIDDAIKTLEEKKPQERNAPKRQDKIQIRMQKIIKTVDMKKRIQSLERQNLSLREKVELKERKIRELKKKISELQRKYNLEVRRDREIRKREQTIKRLKYSMREFQKQLLEFELFKKLWKDYSENRIRPVGIFPEIYHGMSLINRKIRQLDREKLEDIQVAFVDKPEDYKFLRESGVSVFDRKYLNELPGFFYIRTNTLEKLMNEEKKTEVTLDRLIEEYRKERFPNQ